MRKDTPRGQLFLLIACFLWGAGPLINKIALLEMPVLLFTGLRFLIATIVLCLIYKDSLRNISKDVLKAGCVLGLITFLAFITGASATKYVSAIRVGLLLSFEAVFTPILYVILFRRSISPSNIIYLTISFLGLLVMNIEGVGIQFSFGDILALLSAFLYSIHIIILRRAVKRFDAVLMTIIPLFISSVLSLIAFFVNGNYSHLSFSKQTILIVIISALLPGAFAYMLQSIGQKYVSIIKTEIIYSTIPVFSIVIPMVLIGEKLTTYECIGAVLIITVIVLSNIYIDKQKFKMMFVKKKSL